MGTSDARLAPLVRALLMWSCMNTHSFRSLVRHLTVILLCAAPIGCGGEPLEDDEQAAEEALVPSPVLPEPPIPVPLGPPPRPPIPIDALPQPCTLSPTAIARGYGAASSAGSEAALRLAAARSSRTRARNCLAASVQTSP